MLRQYIRLVKLNSIARISSNYTVSTEVYSNYHRISAPSCNLILQHARFSQKFNFSAEKEDFRQHIATQDSDTFGTLSPNVNKADDDFQDEGDIQEEKIIRNPPKKSQALSTKQYADQIKEHLKYNRIKEAIDVLEVNIKDDGFRPMNYIFNLLIDGCAKVGYTKKAFNLFTRMRQRALRVTGATYTSLFNACANGPYPSDSLEKANRLREIMFEKGFEPNISNYHAMMKAYGRCGDISTAFLLVDEMIQKKLTVTTETFNFLLQACASDKQLGFRHALLVWHKMYQKKLKPDIYSFNLMLRCCRDTELGDIESTEEVVQTILLRNPKEHTKFIENQQQINDETPLLSEPISKTEIIERSKNENDDELQITPNLLAPRPYLGNLIQIKEVKKAEDRLLLLGGFVGFLELMDKCYVHPTLKTFTALIEVMPNTKSAETKLLKNVRAAKIKCDIDFFNIIIKKRALRQDYDGAREVIDDMIMRARLEPNIVTYGVLALSCQSREQAFCLVNEMNEKGIKMNLPILGAMLKQGCYSKNFKYIMDVLYMMKQFQMKPDERVFKTLEIFVGGCNYLKKKDNKNIPVNYRRDVKKFKEDLAKWKEAMGISADQTVEERKIIREKPWDQFQSSQPEGFEELNDENLRRKQKLRRHIKQIKMKNVLINDTNEEEKNNNNNN